MSENEAAAKPMVKPIKNAPEFTSVEILPGRQVKLCWCDAVGAQKYIVNRFIWENGERKKTRLEVLTNEFTSYTDKSIEEDGSYEYRITAYKKLSSSEKATKASKYIQVNIESIDPPQLKNVEANGRKIKIQWQKDPELYGYVVLRRFSFMKKAMPIAVLTNGEEEYEDSKFAKGQLIYYSIQSIKSDGDNLIYSKPSNELCSVVLPKPFVLKHKKKLYKKAYFKVRLCAGADGYILIRTDRNENSKEVCKTNGIDSFELLDAEKGKREDYFYTVKCFKESKEGDIFVSEASDPIRMWF